MPNGFFHRVPSRARRSTPTRIPTRNTTAAQGRLHDAHGPWRLDDIYNIKTPGPEAVSDRAGTVGGVIRCGDLGKSGEEQGGR